MPATLEYGLFTDGRLRHITQVNNGLKCNCVCPNDVCGQRLIARNNPSNTIAFNFAHESGAECKNAKESELHMRSKEIICDHREIMLPNRFKYLYEFGKMEASVDKYRADVSLTGKQDPLLVEIVVTCEVKSEKEIFLRQSGKRTLVIDLCEIPRDVEQATLSKLLLESWESKYMIEPFPVKTNTEARLNWSVQKIIGVILVAGITVFWAIPTFFKYLGKPFEGTKRRKH